MKRNYEHSIYLNKHVRWLCQKVWGLTINQGKCICHIPSVPGLFIYPISAHGKLISLSLKFGNSLFIVQTLYWEEYVPMSLTFVPKHSVKIDLYTVSQFCTLRCLLEASVCIIIMEFECVTIFKMRSISILDNRLL